MRVARASYARHDALTARNKSCPASYGASDGGDPRRLPALTRRKSRRQDKKSDAVRLWPAAAGYKRDRRGVARLATSVSRYIIRSSASLTSPAERRQLNNRHHVQRVSERAGGLAAGAGDLRIACTR